MSHSILGGELRLPPLYRAPLDDHGEGGVTQVTPYTPDAARTTAITAIPAKPYGDAPLVTATPVEPYDDALHVTATSAGPCDHAPHVSATTGLDAARSGADLVFAAMRVGGACAVAPRLPAFQIRALRFRVAR